MRVPLSPGWIVATALLAVSGSADTLVKPAYLQSCLETESGWTVIRVSGDPGTPVPNLSRSVSWSDEVRHHYSLDQAWNADQTLLALDRNRNGCPNLLLDGKTFEVVSEFPFLAHESRWHPVEPAVRVYVGGNEVGYFDVRRRQKTVVAAFAGYERLSLANKGNVSDDGTRVAVFGRRTDGRTVAFAYDLVRKVKYPDLVAPRSTEGALAANGCTISPSGRYLVWHRADDSRVVYDLEGREIFATESANPTHCDLGYDSAGDEVLVGRSNLKPHAGHLITRRLRDGHLTVIVGPANAKLGCGHVSMRSVRRPGWAYCSGVFYPPYAGWVIAVKLDSSRTVEKLGRVINERTDYATESHASPSWDGRKVVFCSNWNAPTGRPVQAYVLGAPGAKRFTPP